MSIQDVDAVFSSTRKCGGSQDINTWSRAGLTGAWTNRDIQIFGRNSVCVALLLLLFGRRRRMSSWREVFEASLPEPTSRAIPTFFFCLFGDWFLQHVRIELVAVGFEVAFDEVHRVWLRVHDPLDDADV